MNARQFFLFVILSLGCSNFASAQLMPPEGERWVQVASRPNPEEARAVASEFRDRWQESQVFLSQNGWYAIVIGSLPAQEGSATIDAWKADGIVPDDTVMMTGQSYVQRLVEEATSAARAMGEMAATSPQAIPVVAEAVGGLDWTYERPNEQRSWGDHFLRFFGFRHYERNYALVLGISSYAHFTDLGTSEDPLRMARYLIEQAEYDHVRVLTGSEVTPDRVREVIQQELFSVVGERDRLLVYWSGHGVTRLNVANDAVGLLPTSTSRPDDVHSMVLMQDLKDWVLDWVRAEQVLFLMDACFSGHGGTRAMSDERLDRLEDVARPARQMLTAGTSDQQTFVSERHEGGVFTRAVLDGLAGGADQFDPVTQAVPDGVITSSELNAYVRERVRIERDAHDWHPPISPQLINFGQPTGEFFFLSPRSSKDEALAAVQAPPRAEVPNLLVSAKPVVVTTDETIFGVPFRFNDQLAVNSIATDAVAHSILNSQREPGDPRAMHRTGLVAAPREIFDAVGQRTQALLGLVESRLGPSEFLAFFSATLPITERMVSDTIKDVLASYFQVFHGVAPKDIIRGRIPPPTVSNIALGALSDENSEELGTRCQNFDPALRFYRTQAELFLFYKSLYGLSGSHDSQMLWPSETPGIAYDDDVAPYVRRDKRQGWFLFSEPSGFEIDTLLASGAANMLLPTVLDLVARLDERWLFRLAEHASRYLDYESQYLALMALHPSLSTDSEIDIIVDAYRRLPENTALRTYSDCLGHRTDLEVAVWFETARQSGVHTQITPNQFRENGSFTIEEQILAFWHRRSVAGNVDEASAVFQAIAELGSNSPSFSRVERQYARIDLAWE